MFRSMKKPYAEITCSELQQRLDKGEKIILIDVREKHEFAQGRVPGSKLIPLGELAQRQNEINKEKETIFICRSGNRSGQACSYLHRLGYSKVTNLKEGMLGWRGQVER